MRDRVRHVAEVQRREPSATSRAQDQDSGVALGGRLEQGDPGVSLEQQGRARDVDAPGRRAHGPSSSPTMPSGRSLDSAPSRVTSPRPRAGACDCGDYQLRARGRWPTVPPTRPPRRCWGSVGTDQHPLHHGYGPCVARVPRGAHPPATIRQDWTRCQGPQVTGRPVQRLGPSGEHFRMALRPSTRY